MCSAVAFGMKEERLLYSINLLGFKHFPIVMFYLKQKYTYSNTYIDRKQLVSYPQQFSFIWVSLAYSWRDKMANEISM